MLSVLDRKWREHLYEMDYLREGIGLRAYSQRDPLVEYQREGFDMFMAMMDGIKEESVGFLFNLEVQLVDDDEPVEDEVEEEPLRRELRSLDQPDRDGHDHRPQITRQGPRPSRSRRSTCPTPRRPRTTRLVPLRSVATAAFGGTVPSPRRRPGHDGDQRRRRVRRGRPQRAVPLRLGQEVQALPRSPRAARPGSTARDQRLTRVARPPSDGSARPRVAVRQTPGRRPASGRGSARTGRRRRGSAGRSARAG